MSPNFLRLAYMMEFLIALVAIQDVWVQVGGQSHLELMPWYTKLSLTMGLALMTTIGTACAVAHDRAWNAKTIACLLIALMIAGGMAATTFYYHLHENDDQGPGEDGGAISYLIAGAHA